MELIFTSGLFTYLVIFVLVLSLATMIYVLVHSKLLSVLEIIGALFLILSFPLFGSLVSFYLVWRKKVQLKEAGHTRHLTPPDPKS